MRFYIDQLRAGAGEATDGLKEGYNLARLRDPFRGTAGRGISSVIQVPGLPLDFSQPVKTINNSWSTQKTDKLRGRGRIGYSVKFVSFDYLRKSGGGATSDGQNPWSNIEMNVDSEILDEINALKH